VVAALDGSPGAELSWNAALDLAKQLQLPVHLLRVIPPFIPVDELAKWLWLIIIGMVNLNSVS
jgi:nucleotide-binding universal stress UspA family protein